MEGVVVGSSVVECTIEVRVRLKTRHQRLREKTCHQEQTLREGVNSLYRRFEKKRSVNEHLMLQNCGDPRYRPTSTYTVNRYVVVQTMSVREPTTASLSRGVGDCPSQMHNGFSEDRWGVTNTETGFPFPKGLSGNLTGNTGQVP